MSLPNPITGAAGGWWSYSSPALPISAPKYFLRIEVGGGLIAEFQIVPGSATSVGPIWTAVQYFVKLRYQVGTVVELVSDTPVPDSALGKATTGHPRTEWAGSYRWAITFQTGTYNSGTGTYASDGFVNLYLNGSTTPLLSATGIPLRGHFTTAATVRYYISPSIDFDRFWARTAAIVLPTTAEGAIIGTAPTDLVLFDDFPSGDFSAWTPISTFTSGGTATSPYAWVNAGGDDSWGLSTYCCSPPVATCDAGLGVVPYAGLFRDLTPPDPPWSFDSVFAGPLDTDFDAPGYTPYDPSTHQRISGRGIDYGMAYTCSLGFLAKELAPRTTTLSRVTVRVQYGARANAPLLVQKRIIGLSAVNPDGSGSTSSFVGELDIAPDGALVLVLNDSVAGGGTPGIFTTAAGTIPLDTGVIQGIQLTIVFDAPVFRHVTYQLVVNNVVLLSGTYTASAPYYYNMPPVPAGVNLLDIFADRPRFGNNAMVVFAEVHADNAAAIISYPASNAIPAALDACTPFIPPVVIVPPAIELPHAPRAWRIYRLDSKPRQESSS